MELKGFFFRAIRLITIEEQNSIFYRLASLQQPETLLLAFGDAKRAPGPEVEWIFLLPFMLGGRCFMLVCCGHLKLSSLKFP